ncbi:hypothetical protein ACFL2T_06695 [Elusimicrobiota bacterium]
MKIRQIHRICASILSPLFLISAVSGCVLLFRKTGLYGKEAKSFLVSLHTWEVIAPYVGIVVGLGLMVMTVTGMIVYFRKSA